MSRDMMLNKFEWPKAEEEVDEIIIRNVRKHGCHIVGIPTDEIRGRDTHFRSACLSTTATPN
jgi:hypothetical protein